MSSFLQQFTNFLFPRASTPDTFDGILEAYLTSLSEADILTYRMMDVEDLHRLHHSEGRRIRNTWGLWKEDHPLTRTRHPDDVSYDILVAAWRKLNNT